MKTSIFSRVMDYQTGATLDGRPSPELVAASLAVPHTGAVGARRDAEGTWQFVRPEDSGPDTRTVWVDAPPAPRGWSHAG